MANGKVIEEIRNIVKEGGKISTVVRDRLILTALGEIYEKIADVPDIKQKVCDHDEAIKKNNERWEDRRKENRATWIAVIMIFISQVVQWLFPK